VEVLSYFILAEGDSSRWRTALELDVAFAADVAKEMADMQLVGDEDTQRVHPLLARRMVAALEAVKEECKESSQR
jgi:hypothetical protein